MQLDFLQIPQSVRQKMDHPKMKSKLYKQKATGVQFENHLQGPGHLKKVKESSINKYPITVIDTRDKSKQK